jgi:FkbM family methyltransferase
MSLLRSIRQQPIINRIGRALLHSSGSLLAPLKRKWRVSGEVTCRVDEVSFRMFSRCDDGIVDALYYGSNYDERSDLSLFLALAARSRQILDIGANTGVYSLCSAAQDPAARIFAFEPNPVNAARFRRNVSLNRFENIVLDESAIGSQSGSIEFNVPENNQVIDVSSASREFSEQFYPGLQWKKIRVPVKTVDEIRSSLPGPAHLVKCDVESYEMEVFRGARETIAADRPAILFECFPDEEKIRFFRDFLDGMGYSTYRLSAGTLEKLENNILSDKPGLNYLVSPMQSGAPSIPISETSHVHALLNTE